MHFKVGQLVHHDEALGIDRGAGEERQRGDFRANLD
jgi:hypothetical protein